jgi:hypothetical protein
MLKQGALDKSDRGARLPGRATHPQGVHPSLWGPSALHLAGVPSPAVLYKQSPCLLALVLAWPIAL